MRGPAFVRRFLTFWATRLKMSGRGAIDKAAAVPRKRPSLLLILLALLLAPAPALAQQSEAAVKADFIPKFARYVQWPANVHPAASQPFQLCVIGRDPFGELLDRAAAAEQIEGHTILVRRLRDARRRRRLPYGVRPGDPARGDRRDSCWPCARSPVLTITDSRAGPQRGMIHFTVSAGRVRFFIDEAAAAEHGLAISSRLLALALGVRQRRS